jgi:hypothetical protein
VSRGKSPNRKTSAAERGKSAMTDADRTMLRDLITLTTQLRRMRYGNEHESACLGVVIDALDRMCRTGRPLTGASFGFLCIWPSQRMGRKYLNPIAMIGADVPRNAKSDKGIYTIGLSFGYHDYFSWSAADGYLVQCWKFGPSKVERTAWDASHRMLGHQDFISFTTAVRRLKLAGSGVHVRASIHLPETNPCVFTCDDTLTPRWHEDWSDEEWRLVERRNIELGYRTRLFHGETPMFCDLCGRDLAAQMYMINSRLIGSGIDADLCVPCAARQSRGVGRGRGRLYMRHENGGWFCVAGFSSRPRAA